jgi:hypothetical protein
MLDPLKEVLPKSLLVATTVPGTANSLPPTTLANAWGEPVMVESSPDVAFRRVGQQGQSIITGSLYLVGYLRNKVT